MRAALARRVAAVETARAGGPEASEARHWREAMREALARLEST